MSDFISALIPTEEEVERYLRHLANELHRAPRTVAAYREELSLLVRRQVALDPDSLAIFVSYTADQRPLAATTRNRRLAVIRGFCRYQVAQHQLASDPSVAIRRGRVPRSSKIAHSVEDFRKVLAILRAQPRSWRRTRNEAIIFTFFYCGIRVSELVELDVDQVDLEHGFLWQMRRKGGHYADVLLEGSVKEALAAWLDARPRSEDYALFLAAPERRMGVRQVEKMLAKLGKEAGLTNPFRPHALRHDHATVLLNVGGSLKAVQDSLGHASISTTEKYLHPGEEQQRAALRRLPDLNRPTHG